MPKWYGGSTLNPDELVQTQHQWRDQWDRTLRWFGRVQRIKDASLKRELYQDDFDVVIAFFQNCYHVRDWLSSSRPELQPRLTAFFRQHFEMGACRDLCNGFKHKNLTSATHDPDFNLYREYDYFEIMADSAACPYKYRAVFADGNDIRKFDLFDLVEQCMTLWRGFLRENGLEDAASC